MTLKLDPQSLAVLRRIAAGYTPPETELASLNGTAEVARAFAQVPDDQRHSKGYTVLARLGLSNAQLRAVFDLPNSAVDAADGAQRGGDQLLPLRTIPALELYRREFQPRQFLVESVLAAGDVMGVFGRPKLGKSWAVLQLAQAIDAGGTWLGKRANHARLLYVALEDGQRRLHERMHIRHWEPTPDAHFICPEPGQMVLALDDGGASVERLKLTAEANGTQLIVVDTLIAAMAGKADESSNSEMGAILNPLATWVRETGRALVFVHHTTKSHADDPFNTIRGASAIRGAYDVGIVLQRELKEAEAVIHLESRDREGFSLTARFDQAHGWQYEGDGERIEAIRAGRKVVAALSQLGDDQTAAMVAKHLGITEGGARQQLNLAERDGHVTRRDGQRATNGKATDLWSLARA